MTNTAAHKTTKQQQQQQQEQKREQHENKKHNKNRRKYITYMTHSGPKWAERCCFTCTMRSHLVQTSSIHFWPHGLLRVKQRYWPLSVSCLETLCITCICHSSHQNHNCVVANYAVLTICVLAKGFVTHRLQNHHIQHTYKIISFPASRSTYIEILPVSPSKMKRSICEWGIKFDLSLNHFKFQTREAIDTQQSKQSNW